MNNSPNICWICGAPATTGEHQQKKSDVTKIFGAGTFDSVVKLDLDSGEKVKIQGPNSKELKYTNNLCANCNNKRTQPYDFAYSKFAAYVQDNFAELKRTLCINTNVIFGKACAKKQRCNLFLYFVKAFGCQLNDNGLSVPQGLRDALLGKNYDNTFRISVCLNQEPQPSLQNFSLEGGQDEHEQPVDFFWAQDNGWFTVVHTYNRPVSEEFGEKWNGKSRQFWIGIWESSNHTILSDAAEH